MPDTSLQELSNKVIVTINGKDEVFDFETLSINFNSSEQEILDVVNPLLSESLQDEDGDFTYTTRKSSESQNIFVYPKPGAGE